MEQEAKVQPETGASGPNQEQMDGTGFSGNAGTGETGSLESGAESCGCEHETVTAPVDGQSPMVGGPVGIPGASMGQTEAPTQPQQNNPQQQQYQQPPQVQPQYQAQPQYQPRQAPPVYSAPPFPPQQPQQGPHSPQYAPAGYPGMPYQGSNMGPDMSPQMNPSASGQGCGHMGADAKHVEHDENRFGQMADMVGRFMQGEATTSDMVRGIFSLNFRDDQFWKGALAGALTALLLNSDMVKQGVGKIFGGGSAKAGQSPEIRKEAVKEAEPEAKTKKSQ